LPKNEEELIFSLDRLRDGGIKYKIIGRMSNILPTDSVFPGVLLKTDGISKLEFKDNIAYVGAGVGLPLLSLTLCRNGLSGVEELSGIPGSLGGAVSGNAGAYGKSIADILICATAYSPSLKRLIRLDKASLGFTERGSLIKTSDLVILSAELALTPRSSEIVFRRTEELKKTRMASQPKEPSLGSTFKRPKGDYASRLIDLAGLKGTKIGGAEVSRKHAGFIINSGNATARDYKELCSLIEKRVYERFGVALEREVEFLE
jgi:UDP-N-acetylmuramate dehydrogenase